MEIIHPEVSTIKSSFWVIAVATASVMRVYGPQDSSMPVPAATGSQAAWTDFQEVMAEAHQYKQ